MIDASKLRSEPNSTGWISLFRWFQVLLRSGQDSWPSHSFEPCRRQFPLRAVRCGRIAEPVKAGQSTKVATVLDRGVIGEKLRFQSLRCPILSW
jgi:hypothetical protein